MRSPDELVQIVPGANLGKMLWRHGGGERHSLLAYFALKSDVSSVQSNRA